MSERVSCHRGRRWALGFALLLPACAGQASEGSGQDASSGDASTMCRADADCGADQVCLEGQCTTAAENTGTTGSGSGDSESTEGASHTSELLAQCRMWVSDFDCGGFDLSQVIDCGVLFEGSCERAPYFECLRRALVCADGRPDFSGFAACEALDPCANDSSGEASSASDSASASEDESDGDSGGDDDCGEVHFAWSYERSTLLVVLDASAAMSEPMGGDASAGSRWDQVFDSFDHTLDTYLDQVDFGVQLSPALAHRLAPTQRCNVDDSLSVNFGTHNKFEYLARMPEKGSALSQSSPLFAATEAGLEALVHAASYNTSALLLTHGTDECGGDMSRLENRISELAQAGTPTYVAAIDQDDPAVLEQLERLAAAGRDKGTVIEAEQLSSVFETVIESNRACTLELDMVPAYPEYFHVAVDGLDVPQLEGFASCEEAHDHGQSNGWLALNERTIEICGGYCEAFAHLGVVDLTYGCPPPD